MKNKLFFSLILFVVIFVPSLVFAQTNEFTFQGRLNDGSMPASGNYDLQFGLYPSVSGSFALGIRERFGVPVSNGSFTVSLDFPATSFSGADRYLEISVKPAGGGTYTLLTPRQRITSSPYAVQSLNAKNAENAVTATTATNSTQLGGFAASEYIQRTDPRLTDDRSPLPGSAYYIRNTTTQQTANLNVNGSSTFGSNLTVNGSGTFGGNLTVNGTLTANLPAGDTSYIQNGTTAQVGTTNFNISGNGTANNFSASFFNATTNFRIGGQRVVSVIAPNNTYVGIGTGLSSAGADNSFFGFNAGGANGLGNDNSFFGSDAGGVNNDGIENSFFGSDTGDSNISGDANSFFGRSAGTANISGSNNTFLGQSAGVANTSGSGNTVLGSNANVGAGNLTFATAVGSGAIVTSSNTIQIGRVNHINTPYSGDTTRVGALEIGLLPFGAANDVCMTGGTGYRIISNCTSSRRFKNNIRTYFNGFDVVRRLRPVTYEWRTGGAGDIGFIAEEVAEVEPLLATYDEQGQIAGVKYKQITTVLVNAVKEQQEQIERQEKRIGAQDNLLEQQAKQIAEMRTLLCAAQPDAAMCKEEK